METKFSYFI